MTPLKLLEILWFARLETLPRCLERNGLRIAAGVLTVVLLAQSAMAGTLSAAHRGGRTQGPENTLEVFALTMALGSSPWLETDSWLSADGVPMLHHDRDLCRTTNIETLPGYDCDVPANNPLGRLPEVRDFTVAELKALDVGEWFGPAWAGTQMPTLEEALLLLKGTGFQLLVQINSAGQQTPVKDMLENNAIPLDTIVIWARGFGFDAWHTAIPGVRQITGQYHLESVDDALLTARSAAGDFGIAVQGKGIDKAFVDWVHSYGLIVYQIPTATGTDPYDVQLAAGVDVIHVQNETEWYAYIATRPCSDRADNDLDLTADAHGVDIDMDGVIDVPADPECVDPLDLAEVPQCQDGLDNDGDTLIDLADPDCADANGLYEQAPLPEPVPALALLHSFMLMALLSMTGGHILRSRRSGRAGSGFIRH